MFIPSPLPRGGLGRLHEASSMRSIRDKDSVGNAWKATNRNVPQLHGVTSVLARLQNQINQLRRRVPTLINQPTTEVFYPFKIYQPDLTSLPAFGLLCDASGNYSEIAIDSTVPTNMPITVNPNTDAWRFWAVRNGQTEFRPYFGTPINSPPQDLPLNNYAQIFDIFSQCIGFPGVHTRQSGTDGFSDYFSTSTTIAYSQFSPLSNGDVLVLTGTDPANPGQISDYTFFIEITPDTLARPGLFKASVKYKDVTGLITMPAFSNLLIPIGLMQFVFSGTPTILQYLSAHCLNRYPAGQYSAGNPVARQEIPSALIYRGCWQIDAAIQNMVFYPGDVILFQPAAPNGTITNGGATFHTTTSQWLMCKTNVTTVDPSIDANFVTIGTFISAIA